MNNKCICCNGTLNSLMTMEHMPSAAQHMPTEKTLNEDKALTLELCQCRECGLVQFDVDPVWYYRDVIRAGGGSSTMRKLRTEEYERFIRTIHEYGVECRSIVEVGCGKGEFLGMWPVDLQLVNIARQAGLNVHQGFAEGDYVFPDAPYDAFVQFNFLEHQPDPVGMLRNIRHNLKPNGFGLITVPDLEYILRYDGYYELMRDHIAYYTPDTLRKVISMAGFEEISHRTVNRDTIEMIVRSNANAVPADVSSLERNYRQMQEDVAGMNCGSMAVWGASHQAFTIAATTGLRDKVKYIIDSAKFKQGKYSPASHIKIFGPEHFFDDPVQEILIIAPGYTDEIAGIIRSRYGEGVRILMLKEQRIAEYTK